MDVYNFVQELKTNDIEFFTGIPDSQLKQLCDYLYHNLGISDQHIIAANEGNCVGLAAGYHMSTGKIPCVYMQNSGIGNIVNPVTSLTHSKVYGIPMLFVIGWRGEPMVKDEPQHIFQGEITLTLLQDLEIEYMVIDKETTIEDIQEKMQYFKQLFLKGRSAAFVVRKAAFSYSQKVSYKNQNTFTREQAIECIVKYNSQDVFVSTTGKASRELFEIREKYKQGHAHDFLTVGSMGHSSMIALGIALNKPKSKVWCLDGDGAILMHMGSMTVIGANAPDNLVHVVLNNGAHESVGGMPTVANKIDLVKIALACGYKKGYCVNSEEELIEVLTNIKQENGPILLEIKIAVQSRSDLGRPTTTTEENKNNFMDFLKACDIK